MDRELYCLLSSLSIIHQFKYPWGSRAFPAERSPARWLPRFQQHARGPVAAQAFTGVLFHNLCWDSGDVQRQVLHLVNVL